MESFAVEDEEQGQQLHGALPNDLFLQKILPLLPLIDLEHLPLVSKSWSALCRGNLWRAWCRNQRWLVMLCRNMCTAEMEFVACHIPKGLPSFEDLCWLPLSSAMRACISTLDLSFNTVRALGLEEYYTNDSSVEPVTMYPLDDRCLISGTSDGLMCLIWHANLSCRRPLRSYCPPPKTRAALQLNTAAFTPMLLNIFGGSAQLLPAPDAYVTFDPMYSSGSVRNVFMSMQMRNPATMSFDIILHDDHLNFLEVYSSRTSSWRTVVHRSPCAFDDYPCLNFTTPGVHFGDVFAIRHQVPAALYAYRADSDEWSKVDVEYPPNALLDYCRVFKYNGRVFLAALLMKERRSQPPTLSKGSWQASTLGELMDVMQEVHGFAIWELRPLPATLNRPYSGNTHVWEQVARSPDKVYRGVRYHFFFDKFEIRFVNVGGLVCMSGAFIYEDKAASFRPLVYDIGCDSWFLLPACERVMDYLCVFGFQPGS